MSPEQIVRAWKDVRYRQSLSQEEQALLPTHPAGTLELSASALEHISGGNNWEGGICTIKTELFSGCFPPAIH